MITLSAEQERFVAANLRHAVGLARHEFPGDDEYEGVACEALLKAAVRYVDDGRAVFRTYMTIVVRSAMIDFHRTWRRTKGRERTLDQVNHGLGFSVTTVRHEAIVEGPEVLVTNRVADATLLAKVKAKPLAYAKALVAGATQQQIGDDYGVSQTAISLMLAAEARRLRIQRARLTVA